MNEEMTLDQSVEAAEQELYEKPQNALLPFLKKRLKVAKSFSKDFFEEVDRCIADYEGEENQDVSGIDKLSIHRRYEFVIPYIFATHESMLSSIFERAPDLVFTGRGMKDTEKARKITATYEYLWDKADLDTFITNSAWWFILIGQTTSDVYFKSEYREVQAIDPDTNEPMFDDETGEPVMTVVYDYNDPVVNTDDPKKVYFSPESEYEISGTKVPYYFREQLTTVDDIEELYDIKTKPTAEIYVEGISEEDTDRKDKYEDDLDRVCAYHYFGTLPKKLKNILDNIVEESGGEAPEYEYGAKYHIFFSSNDVFLIEKLESVDRAVKMARWYGVPNKFFGFGIGKTLRQFQKELSIRRGQQIRYADVAAYAKIAVEAGGEVDYKSLEDPRENVVVTYTDNPPSYLTPPDMSATLIQTEEKAREDAQFVSGMLDLSNGSQDSKTVKTATGQTIFAESAEKRVKKARKELGKYLRAVVVQMLKLCAENWDETKIMTITDEDGEELELEVSQEDLSDINFDTDIDIDLESITVNKEVMREQIIALYDKTKDDPLVERRKVIKLVLRDGFNINDAESYIKDLELQPGMVLVEPNSGVQYVVGEDGELTEQAAMDELAEPGVGGAEMASTQAGALDVQP